MRYNHFHDQLLLTSSSDSRVILNNIVSLSSEPFGHLDEEEEDDGMQDKGWVGIHEEEIPIICGLYCKNLKYQKAKGLRNACDWLLPTRESSQLCNQSQTLHVELRHRPFGIFWRESQASFQQGRKWARSSCKLINMYSIQNLKTRTWRHAPCSRSFFLTLPNLYLSFVQCHFTKSTRYFWIFVDESHFWASSVFWEGGHSVAFQHFQGPRQERNVSATKLYFSLP